MSTLRSADKRALLVDSLGEEAVARLDYLLIRFRPVEDLPADGFELFSSMTARQALLLAEYLLAAAGETEAEGQIARLTLLARLSALLGKGKALEEGDRADS